MPFLALGIAADILVVVEKVFQSTTWALVSAGLVLLVFYGLWFGYTAYCRVRLRGTISALRRWAPPPLLHDQRGEVRLAAGRHVVRADTAAPRRMP
jgi:hypothetical protein